MKRRSVSRRSLVTGEFVKGFARGALACVVCGAKRIADRLCADCRRVGCHLPIKSTAAETHARLLSAAARFEQRERPQEQRDAGHVVSLRLLLSDTEIRHMGLPQSKKIV